MTVLDLPSAGKREITSGTREWADQNVNCVKGCSNDCRYCYAKLMAKRFGRCTEDTWKQMKVNQPAVERTFGKYSGRVMFPSTHDIVDRPDVLEACTTVLQKLLEAGNELLITTKPKPSVVKGIMERFRHFKSQIQFRFTITSLHSSVLSFWEPNAPNFEERFEALRYAFRQRFKTSVSIEPYLDHDPAELVSRITPYVTESIWIGPMNYIPRMSVPAEVSEQYAQIRTRYEISHLEQIAVALRAHPKVRFKDSMVNRLAYRSSEY